AKTLIDSGERNADAIRAELERRLRQAKTAKIDYAEIVDTQNLKPLETIQGEILIALAVFFGRTRLIDNIQVSV
ncbi:MAG TPA: pantoate--beta-alanine ligase, partial [Bacteroidetes bacterium]|nr:pantoate--beta-alanine ligase [Bacteroidota bacterium]